MEGQCRTKTARALPTAWVSRTRRATWCARRAAACSPPHHVTHAYAYQSPSPHEPTIPHPHTAPRCPTSVLTCAAHSLSTTRPIVLRPARHHATSHMRTRINHPPHTSPPFSILTLQPRYPTSVLTCVAQSLSPTGSIEAHRRRPFQVSGSKN